MSELWVLRIKAENTSLIERINEVGNISFNYDNTPLQISDIKRRKWRIKQKYTISGKENRRN